MIVKIKKGARMAGLLVYLAGPGDTNEHTNPHVIAGHDAILGRTDVHGELDRDTALAIAHQIDLPRRMFGTKVEQVNKKKAQQLVGAGAPAPEAVADATEDVNVWHCSLAINAGEGLLPDETWARIAQDFMTEMGFDNAADPRSPARWVAIRHGLSENGNDHIHIAASRVREDGTKVSTYDYGPGNARGDWKRAGEVCTALERKYGLTVITTREAPEQDRRASASVPTRAEVEKAAARRAGTRGTSTDPGPVRAEPNQPPRVQLRQVVAETAAAVRDGDEFRRSLEAQGLLFYRRLDNTGRMTGYAVADPHDRNRKGDPIFFAGSTLAPELSWPKLNTTWRERSAPEQAPIVPREMVDKMVTTMTDAIAAINEATKAVRERSEDPAPIGAAAQSLASQWARVNEAGGDRRDAARVAWTHAPAARCAGAYTETTQAGRCARALREASWKISAWGALSAAGRAHTPTLDLALAIGSLMMELAAWHEQSRRPAHAAAARDAALQCDGFTATYRKVDSRGRPVTATPAVRPATPSAVHGPGFAPAAELPPRQSGPQPGASPKR